MIGQTISHYRITAELGSGGMGTVYRAEDLKLDRTVALKFLAPEFLRDPDAKSRFVHEAKAASALDHPNICTIHGIEETADGQLFIAMACYEGETVKDRIARGPLPVEDAVEITVQVAEGLAKAHGLGIVHRDIKPANILVTEDGLVKLLDFGIAKLAGATQMTQAGDVLGTVQYMSPEQVQGGAVDRRSDVWSLEVVLCEMLTAALPFTGERAQAVAYNIVNTEPAPLTERREDIPAEVDRTVARRRSQTCWCTGSRKTATIHAPSQETPRDQFADPAGEGRGHRRCEVHPRQAGPGDVHVPGRPRSGGLPASGGRSADGAGRVPELARIPADPEQHPVPGGAEEAAEDPPPRPALAPSATPSRGQLRSRILSFDHGLVDRRRQAAGLEHRSLR
jgi:serine/threonine protein kinase